MRYASDYEKLIHTTLMEKFSNAIEPARSHNFPRTQELLDAYITDDRRDIADMKTKRNWNSALFRRKRLKTFENAREALLSGKPEPAIEALLNQIGSHLNLIRQYSLERDRWAAVVSIKQLAGYLEELLDPDGERASSSPLLTPSLPDSHLNYPSARTPATEESGERSETR